MTSDDIAKIWLWLEGYEHVRLDSAFLWRFTVARLTAARTVLQEPFAGLPDIATRTATDEQKGSALDALNDFLGVVMTDRHASPRAERAAALVTAAALGLDVRDAWVAAHDPGDGAQSETPDPDSLVGSPLVRALLAEQRVPLPDAPLPGEPLLSIAAILPAFALPRLAQRPVDWKTVRLLCQALCVMSDVPQPHPETAPWVDWLRTVRRWLYGAGDDGLVLALAVLAGVSSLAPSPEMRRHARRMLACYGRDEPTSTAAQDGSKVASA